MEKRYKVGNVTDFGKLLAEAVKYDNSSRIVSLYEIDDKDEMSTYLLIIWEISVDKTEYELSRTKYEIDETAIFSWIEAAFGVSV